VIIDVVALERNRRRITPRMMAPDTLWHAMGQRMEERLLEVRPAAGRRILIAPAAVPCIASEHRMPGEWLQLPAQHYAVAMHLGALHLANDVPGILVQMRLALAPGGLLIAMFAGGETLRELRAALAAAESQVLGGISPRVIPFLNPEEGGNLLTRAGFKEPVIDRETLTLTYPDLTTLMHELRAMGQANPLAARQKSFTPRGLFMAAEEYYRARFSDREQRLRMTVELVTLTAWT
jgi:hypothetical protein